MARITPRSINIREMERACNHLEDVMEYYRRYMETLKEGIDQYELLKIEVPDIYVSHMDKMITLFETISAAKDVTETIRKEL